MADNQFLPVNSTVKDQSITPASLICKCGQLEEYIMFYVDWSFRRMTTYLGLHYAQFGCQYSICRGIYYLLHILKLRVCMVILFASASIPNLNLYMHYSQIWVWTTQQVFICKYMFECFMVAELTINLLNSTSSWT